MTELTLDTSGAVCLITAEDHASVMTRLYRWPDLSPFAQGYVAAAFAGAWADAGFRADWFAGYGVGGKMPGFHDLAPTTLAAMLKDCEAYQKGVHGSYSEDRLRLAGEMFWKCRQGQVPWAMKSDADLFPPLTLTLADDGLIYQREAST